MTSGINHQIRLAGRPVGLPKRSDWQFIEAPIPEPRDGEVLVRVLYLSLDPAMRGWMNEGKSYIAPVGIGDVMRAGAVGKVVSSNHPKFVANDFVSGGFGVQEYAALDGAQLTKIDPGLAPLPTFLNALGMPGMTAYFGLLDVGDPKKGDTVVVSAASGAVGATVGQIAKIKGCRAVGIAGGAAKCRYIVDELGFDAAIDYKSEDVRKTLRTHCPPASTCISTMSAATYSTLPSRNWPGMPASSYAAPSPNTTTRRRSKDRATISPSWSTGRAWRGWSCLTMPPDMRKPPARSPRGSPPASSNPVRMSSRAWQHFPKRCSSCSAGKISASWF